MRSTRCNWWWKAQLVVWVRCEMLIVHWIDTRGKHCPDEVRSLYNQWLVQLLNSFLNPKHREKNKNNKVYFVYQLSTCTVIIVIGDFLIVSRNFCFIYRNKAKLNVPGIGRRTKVKNTRWNSESTKSGRNSQVSAVLIPRTN